MAEIPEAFHELLRSRAVAFVSTIGRSGEPQVTPLWFLWDGERVQISLVEGRQKLRNLRRDPRIAIAIADPARPTFYLELRGTVSELVPDPGLELERDRREVHRQLGGRGAARQRAVGRQRGGRADHVAAGSLGRPAGT